VKITDSQLTWEKFEYWEEIRTVCQLPRTLANEYKPLRLGEVKTKTCVNSIREVMKFRCHGHKLQEHLHSGFGQLTIKRCISYLVIDWITKNFLSFLHFHKCFGSSEENT
jgi:hypothetical protein